MKRLVLLVLAACGPLEPPGDPLRSNLARESPSLAEVDLAGLVAGRADLDARLLRALAEGRGNLVFSGHSIASALAMLYAGAEGETERQMATALAFRVPEPGLHSAFNALDRALASRPEDRRASDGGDMILDVANALFVDRQQPVAATFLDVLARHYGAAAWRLDLSADPAGSRDAINAWIAERTREKIPKLLGDDQIDARTRLVLVNAVYFDGAWKDQLRAESVRFLDRTVPGFAGESDAMRWRRAPSYELVSLPYDGDELDLVVLAPNAGTLEAFAAALDGPRLGAILTATTTGGVALQMPSFEMRTRVELKPILSTFGMPIAFDGSADFTGIDPAGGLFVQFVQHEAYIVVNERGTVAAAATGVGVGRTSLPVREPISIDRPFLFFLRDRPTGAILFAGRVEDPTAR